MNVWVLGAQGLLGRSVMRIYKKNGVRVMATGKSEADICHLPTLIAYAKQWNPTHIINCAAFTDVDDAENNESFACAVNREGARNVAEVARRYGAQYIHISTDYVFDGEGQKAYEETAQCQPLNVYGKSKWEGELAVLNAYPAACILRISWLFGPGGRNFFSCLPRILCERKELVVAAEQRGRLTYVEDAAAAIVQLQDRRGIWHFANSGIITRFDIATYVQRKLMNSGQPIVCERVIPLETSSFSCTARRPRCSVLDTTKYVQETGQIPRDWKKAIDDFIKE